jgi:flagellar basal body-associated protein FliL
MRFIIWTAIGIALIVVILVIVLSVVLTSSTTSSSSGSALENSKVKPKSNTGGCGCKNKK